MSVMTSCPDGVTDETLSALTDGGLDTARTARLRAHAAACPACQATLAAYDAVDRLVREQPIPATAPMDIAAVRAGRAGRAVRAGRASNLVQAPRRMDRPRIPRAVWGGIGAAVAAALLIAAFSQVFTHLGLRMPTATTHPLTWSERALPPGLLNGQYSIAFSPASDQVAWVCEPQPNEVFTIWATTDQARTWHFASRIVASNPQAAGAGCALTPDSLNPRALALTFVWNCDTCAFSYTTEISTDGGVNWRTLPGGAQPWALATRGGHTYYLGYETALHMNKPLLLVSDDGFAATMRALNPGGSQVAYQHLWLNPTTNALLLSDDYTLWYSPDGGATWTQTAVPKTMNAYLGGWIPALNTWRVCGYSSPTINLPNSSIQCSTDLGKTWITQPTLVQDVTCSNCSQSGGEQAIHNDCLPKAMAPDGSLLAYCQQAGTTTANPDGVWTGVWNVYRLTPGATAWESLGPPPALTPSPYATPVEITPAGTPAQTSAQTLNLTFSGNQSTTGPDVWYLDTTNSILAVAPLP